MTCWPSPLGRAGLRGDKPRCWLRTLAAPWQRVRSGGRAARWPRFGREDLRIAGFPRGPECPGLSEHESHPRAAPRGRVPSAARGLLCGPPGLSPPGAGEEEPLPPRGRTPLGALSREVQRGDWVGLCPCPGPRAPSTEGFPHGLVGRGPCARHLAENFPEADGWGGPWEREEPGHRGDSVAWRGSAHWWCAGLA